jgi:hypothetical protein
VEDELKADAEEFWGVRTVTLMNVPADGQPVASSTAVAEIPKSRRKRVMGMVTYVWVQGLELPADLVGEDMLTDEDRRDLMLDHIARTSDLVGSVEILKWA